MGFLRGRVASFGYAFKGIAILVRTQRNAQIHLAATVIVVTLGFVANFNATEWCLISFSVAGVWVAEAFNTAIEYLADAAVPERHPLVGKAKDVAAAAVLIVAVNAVVVGVMTLGRAFSAIVQSLVHD